MCPLKTNNIAASIYMNITHKNYTNGWRTQIVYWYYITVSTYIRALGENPVYYHR